MKKILIVGGVAGGASAAARLRRLDEEAQIIVFERSGYVSYANCGLPYYVGGVIEDKNELSLQTPRSFQRRFRIDVRVKHNVLSIDRVNKSLKVQNLESGEIYEESYNKLILSPGAKPVVPSLPEIDGDNIFTLRTVEDSLKIRQYIVTAKPESAVVAGGGFIGIETAENLRKMGIDVTIVQRPKQVLKTLDADMVSFVHAELRKNGVKLRLGSAVEGFRHENGKIYTMLKDEEPVKSDMVILAIGVSPDTVLAKEAGLELGVKDSIVVDEHMRTSDPDIYAVGDAVQVGHLVGDYDTVIPLAGPANKQGRIAADNICGINSRYKGTQGSAIVKVFSLTAASTGLNETEAKNAGIEYQRVVLSPPSHAGYYPGGKVLTLKMLYAMDDLRVLGAQIVGYDGVDKRIDVLATAIRCGMKAPELKELELAYAPPFSSAKDPVNFAGYMAENIKLGLVKQFHWQDMEKLPRDGSVTLLDTRTPMEYAGGHAPDFVNIPVDELADRVGELDKNKPVYIMCQSGLRSYIACRFLTQKGFDCFNFSGGYRFYNSVTTEQRMTQKAWPCGMDRK